MVAKFCFGGSCCIKLVVVGKVSLSNACSETFAIRFPRTDTPPRTTRWMLGANDVSPCQRDKMEERNYKCDRFEIDLGHDETGAVADTLFDNYHTTMDVEKGSLGDAI